MFRLSQLTTYTVGFLASVVLTAAAYVIVVQRMLSGGPLILAVVALAFAQLLVQMLFFLHLGDETGPRMNLVSFVMTFGLVLLIVVASIWIMDHLNYAMMASPEAMQEYIDSQQAF